MLAFRLRARDLQTQASWRVVPAGFGLGDSVVAPLRHPALEEVVIASGNCLLVSVRECSNGRPGPEVAAGVRAGQLTEVTRAQFRKLANELGRWPLQWQQIVVGDDTEPTGRRDATRALATVRAGAWGTAPTFVMARDAELLGDWDAARLPLHLACARLDPVLAVQFLVDLATPYSRRTLLPGLELVTERSTLTWRVGPHGQGTARIEYPSPMPRFMPGRLTENADVPAGFERIVSTSLSRWRSVTACEAGAELSGGLDSAIVAGLAAGRQGGLRSYGVSLIGPCASDQRSRRRELVALFDLRDTELPIADFLPLAPGTCRVDSTSPVLPWEECYYEVFEALLTVAAAHGTRVMLTGFGGDELCGLWPFETDGRRGQSSRPPPPSAGPAIATRVSPTHPGRKFLTPDALATLSDPVDCAPWAASSRSAVESAALSAARYLRDGIWPIHPLITSELVNFCGRLPAPWRAKRAVQRQLLLRLGCTTRVVHPDHRDDFMPALVRSLRTVARPRVSELFAESRLAEDGIVDGDRLRRAYAAWCETGEPDDVTPFYAAAVSELFLRRLR